MDTSPRTTDKLGADTLEYLRIGGDEVELDADETIIHKGDPGVAVYFILAGDVEVRLQAADGRHLALCRLGPGDLFGELSVLRDEPVSADVASITQVRLLSYPAELFPTALTECEPLRERLLGRLAQNLQRSTTDAWDLFKREQAFSDLARVEGVEDSMVVASARMRGIKKRLIELGEKRESVLIIGGPGTGRTLAARLVHRASGGGGEALIVVDCEELPADGAHAAIFGFCVGGDFREDSGCFGALHLAHGGDLILRNLGALAAEEQQNLARYLRRKRRGEISDFPAVRVIATAHDLEDPHYASEVVEALRSEFTEVVRLPPLADRPRDIVPLARHFLTEIDGPEHRELTQSAEHALVTLRCPVRNVDELRDVVELAARCSAGEEIRADHIFSGLGEDEPFGLALGQPPLVTRFLQRGGLSFLRGLTLVSFVAAIALCITAGTTTAGRLANGFIWTTWEPVVFGLFLLGGALWCTVCPLSTAGRLAKSVVHIDRSPPSWLSGQLAATLPIIGFFAILWVEWIFHMTEVPRGSGFLLLALIFSSIVLCVIYEREVWCRYICPLGRLAVVLAPAAPVSLAADRKLCASTCTTHECYRGAKKIPGCTVFHHPLMTSEAHHCKLCGDCLQSCPHESTGIFLRPPTQGAWRLGGSGSYPSAFAVTLLLLAPLFLAAETTEVMKQPVILTASGFGAILIGILIGWRLPKLLGRRGDNSAAAHRVAASMAVLAWGPLMAVQLRNIPVLGALRIQPDPGTPWPWRLIEGTTFLTVACGGVVLFAAVASAVILWRTRKRCRTELRPIRRLAWRGVTTVWLLSTAVSLLLVF
jgi:transcriptional regulator with AAA-type ATPase domain